MNIVLIGPELEENLSIRYLSSALTRSGHECSIIPFNDHAQTRSVARRVLRKKPDLVGLSLVAQRRFSDYLELTNLLRQWGFSGHITAGGHFASLRACEILNDAPGIDSILHHDGEERIVALADELGNGCAEPSSESGNGCAESRKAASGSGIGSDESRNRWRCSQPPFQPESIDGISWRRTDGSIMHNPPVRVADLDGLAPPTRRKPDRVLGFAKAPIVSSRGCAGSCSFCSIHAWHRQVPGGRLRFRSPASVADEMTGLSREHDVRIFIFHDDDFIHPNPGAAGRRCREILEHAEQGIGAPIAFVIKCRPDEVDEGLFEYLKSKGLVRVYVGIESHSELGIRTLNRRTTPDVNERALAVLRRLGVYPCFNLLIFHPESTIEELEENLDFLSRHVDQPFDIARAELYAHSALEERMVRDGRALLDYRGYDYRIADPRAEAAFRLFANVLWDRHFGGNSIVHRAQDLGFRLGVLNRFCPWTVSADVRARVDSFIREVNIDTVEHMRRLVAVAQDESLIARPEGHASFAESMRREVNSRVRQQSIKWAALSLELEGRALLGRAHPAALPTMAPWPRFLSRAATLVPCVGLALCALNCDHQEAVDPPPPPPAHFSTDVEPRLNQTCTAAGCHAASNPAEQLILETDESYANLVNVPSVQVPGMDRVKPFKEDSSYVIHKLLGDQQTVGGSGERMPKGGEQDYWLIHKITDWISRGAKND